MSINNMSSVDVIHNSNIEHSEVTFSPERIMHIILCNSKHRSGYRRKDFHQHRVSLLEILSIMHQFSGLFLALLDFVSMSYCHGAGVRRPSVRNSCFSETAAWIQPKFCGQLPLYHISRSFFFLLFFFFEIFNFQIFTIFFFCFR